jgi:hypothetical protein
MINNLEPALKFAATGVPVFPCLRADKTPNWAHVPKDIGPDGKRIKGSGGFKKTSTNPEIITRWWSATPEDMIGVATGVTAGFFAVDPDVPRNGSPDGRASWAALKDEHGGHDPTLEVSTPSGGRHVYFKYEARFPVTTAEGKLAGRGINVRGNGGYVCAPPSVAWPSGSYTFNQPFSLEAISPAPHWLYELILPSRRGYNHGSNPAEDINFPHTKENEFRLVAALKFIDADDRNVWYRVGAAIHSTGWDNARDLWHEWSNTSPKFDACDQDKTWSGFTSERDKKISHRTIFKWARDNGWEDKGSAGYCPGADFAEWPEPAPFPALPPVMEFNERFLPETIAPWVMDIADRMQCPPDFVAIAAFTAMASVLGRKIAIRPQRFTDWYEVANLWGLLVARPGMLKSPSMEQTLNPLRGFECAARKDHGEDLKQHALQAEAFKLRKEDAQKRGRAALKDGAADITSILAMDEPEAPKERRYIVNDSNIRKTRRNPGR